MITDRIGLHSVLLPLLIITYLSKSQWIQLSILALLIIRRPKTKLNHNNNSNQTKFCFFFLWEGKSGVPEKTLSEQSREPTNATHVWCWGWNWTLAPLVEGELFHHGNNSALNEAFCNTQIFLSFIFDRTVLSGFNQVFPSKLLLWSCMVRYVLGSLSCGG